MAFLGPLTDMASAILLDPEIIVGRDVVVIWIGGVGYGGVETYPGSRVQPPNDIAAANVVYDSGITVWQVPSNVYSQVSVGYAELEEKIGGTSKLADYLISQLVEWNNEHQPRADRVPFAGRFAGHLVDAVSRAAATSALFPPPGSARKATTSRVGASRSGSSSRSTSGSCSKTCSPRSASSAADGLINGRSTDSARPSQVSSDKGD